VTSRNRSYRPVTRFPVSVFLDNRYRSGPGRPVATGKKNPGTHTSQLPAHACRPPPHAGQHMWERAHQRGEWRRPSRSRIKVRVTKIEQGAVQIPSPLLFSSPSIGFSVHPRLIGCLGPKQHAGGPFSVIKCTIKNDLSTIAPPPPSFFLT
jgi:hypothetical protein